MLIFKWLYLSACLLIVANCQQKVKSVVEVVRHGARTPSPYYSVVAKLLYGIQNSQLTANGFRQHLIFGQTLRRNIYSEFLSREPTFEVQTSPRERCIFSASGHILGLYPDSTINYINNNRNFEIKEDDLPPGFSVDPIRTISINIVDPLKDSIFHPESCYYKGPLSDASGSETQRLLNFLEPETLVLLAKDKKVSDLLPKNPIFTFQLDEIKAGFDTIQKGMIDAFGDLIPYSTWGFPEGDSKYTLSNLESLVDSLIPIRYHYTGIRKSKLTFSDDIERTIRKVSLNNDYTKKIGDSPYQRLVANDIFAKILEKFDANAESFTLLSCHDTNLEYIISNLHDPTKLKQRVIESALTGNEEYDYFCPPFASSFIFELSADDESNGKYVKVLYNNKEVLKDWIDGIDYIPGKGIEYNQFRTVFYKRIVPVDQTAWDCSLP